MRRGGETGRRGIAPGQLALVLTASQSSTRTDLKLRLRRIAASGRTSGTSAWRICGRDEGIPRQRMRLDAYEQVVRTCCLSLAILTTRPQRDSEGRPRQTREDLSCPLLLRPLRLITT